MAILASGKAGGIFFVDEANPGRPKYYFQNIILLISRLYFTDKNGAIYLCFGSKHDSPKW
jgi:hypothetical protein